MQRATGAVPTSTGATPLGTAGEEPDGGSPAAGAVLSDARTAAASVVAHSAARATGAVEALQSLLDAVRTGGIPDPDVITLVPVLVDLAGTLEASLNAVAAQRTMVVALVDELVQAVPAAMAPVPAGTTPSDEDRDHARRALVADLSTRAGASRATTATLVDTATDLAARFPGVLTSMARGELGDRHAREVVRHGDGLPDDAAAAFESDVLAAVASDRTPAGVGRAARRARDRVHPVPQEERHRAATADRAVHVDPAPDGMAWLTAFLPASQALAIHDRVSRIARSLADEPGETRTLSQRRADVLTCLALDAWPASGDGVGDILGSTDQHGPPAWTLDVARRAIRPAVTVTVPALTLLGLSEDPAELEGYGPIDPSTARSLAAHAPSFVRLLTAPHSGAVLSVGRTRYAVPADLRTWLRQRDGTCRFPGCHHPAGRSDLDHTTPFREGGAEGWTSEDNLAHLCPTHHRLKHTSRWSVSLHADGRLTWTSPTGAQHVTRPAARAMDGLARPDPEDDPDPPPPEVAADRRG